ncbi:MAG: PDR/VanB family oxidoreductase [Pseudomonadota bacterium]
MEAQNLSVFIRGMRLESPAVASFELAPMDGGTLPPFDPGAHVDLFLPDGQTRSYSLVSRTDDSTGYRIAVKREAQSRGGSAWLHDAARLGIGLEITSPKGDFALADAAGESIFIAGGIGITPLLPMIEKLSVLGRRWSLHYAAPSAEHMAFRHQLGADARYSGGSVTRYFPGGDGDRMDVRALVAAAPRGAHLYCCGPARMIEEFVAAAADRDPATVHFERFAAAHSAATDGGFTLKLARDGRCLPVPAGKSLLDVLLDAGLDVPYACTQGVCGSCLVPVLGGTPDHRDSFLTDEEKAANRSMLVCCSGSCSELLTLDI